MKEISIGSWAYTIGPYSSKPVPWDEVIATLKGLGFQGVELGGFPPHPNPDDMPDKAQREACKEQVATLGLRFSGLAANQLSFDAARANTPARLVLIEASERIWHRANYRGQLAR